MEGFSIEQAYEIIHMQFLEHGGLMSQVEGGSKLDDEQLQQLEHAIERIQQEWQFLTIVPKSIIKILFDVLPRIEKCIQLYPKNESDLNALYYHFIEWIDKLFVEEPLSEEAAIAIIQQQVTGLQPFSSELYLGHGLNKGSLDLFFSALDSLAIAYKRKEHISKLAAGAMINATHVFSDIIDLYPGPERHMIQETKEKVASHITECLR